MQYLDKFNEAEFNLDSLQKSFVLGDENFKHYLNNFLSSAQSVFWALNKYFNDVEGYDEWKNSRPERLGDKSRIFKELRNVSVKEGPVKNENIIIDFDFGAAGIIIPPYAQVTSPVIDTRIGKIISKATIKTLSGELTEVDPIIVYDFSVVIESHNKIFALDYFLSSARIYMEEINKEIGLAESIFSK